MTTPDDKPIWNPLADQIAFHCPLADELELVFISGTSYVVRVAEAAGGRVLGTYSSVGLAESDLRNAGYYLAFVGDHVLQRWARKGVTLAE